MKNNADTTGSPQRFLLLDAFFFFKLNKYSKQWSNQGTASQTKINYQKSWRKPRSFLHYDPHIHIVGKLNKLNLNLNYLINYFSYYIASENNKFFK